MHPQANRRPDPWHVRVGQLIWTHRRQLALGAALLALATLIVFAAPLLLALALFERHHLRKRRVRSLVVLIAVGFAAVWLWRELRRSKHEPRGPWHPCHQCGYPIGNQSRAHFCSPLCRRLTRLQTRASAGDERAQTRLAWLAREDKHDPAWGEVPF
jgi:hypothetical protein